MGRVSNRPNETKGNEKGSYLASKGRKESEAIETLSLQGDVLHLRPHSLH